MDGGSKKVLGHFTVELTKKELKELRESYEDCRKDEELLFDRMSCKKVEDAADEYAEKKHIEYGFYEIGDTVLTFEDGHKETIENPWY